MQSPFYYSHIEIAEFSQYQYLFDQVAGLLKSGNLLKRPLHLIFYPNRSDAIESENDVI